MIALKIASAGLSALMAEYRDFSMHMWIFHLRWWYGDALCWEEIAAIISLSYRQSWRYNRFATKLQLYSKSVVKRWDEVYILDIDECAIANGGCSHRCVNSPGGHRCECPPGMQINSGGKKCVGEWLRWLWESYLPNTLLLQMDTSCFWTFLPIHPPLLAGQ